MRGAVSPLTPALRAMLFKFAVASSRAAVHTSVSKYYTTHTIQYTSVLLVLRASPVQELFASRLESVPGCQMHITPSCKGFSNVQVLGFQILSGCQRVPYPLSIALKKTFELSICIRLLPGVLQTSGGTPFDMWVLARAEAGQSPVFLYTGKVVRGSLDDAPGTLIRVMINTKLEDGTAFPALISCPAFLGFADKPTVHNALDTASRHAACLSTIKGYYWEVFTVPRSVYNGHVVVAKKEEPELTKPVNKEIPRQAKADITEVRTVHKTHFKHQVTELICSSM